uniref:Uncharacterized protein n=1 Tax=Magnetococcus massalia (strain MO-1) TaxID=451514 RepID=A0A1S7LGX6_MAGMO|nr:Exported protein of unknown function [Candidatus Magnetococcus massalia]
MGRVALIDSALMIGATFSLWLIFIQPALGQPTTPPPSLDEVLLENAPDSAQSMLMDSEPAVDGGFIGGAEPIWLLLPLDREHIQEHGLTPVTGTRPTPPRSKLPLVTPPKDAVEKALSSDSEQQEPSEEAKAEQRPYIQSAKVPDLPEGWWDMALPKLFHRAESRYGGRDWDLNLTASVGRSGDEESEDRSIMLNFETPIFSSQDRREKKSERQAFIEKGTQLIREARTLAQRLQLQREVIQTLNERYQSKPSRTNFQLLINEKNKLITDQQRFWELKVVFEQLIRS